MPNKAAVWLSPFVIRDKVKGKSTELEKEMKAEKCSNDVFSKKTNKEWLVWFCWTGCTDLGATQKTLLKDSPFSLIPQQSLSPERLQ